MVLTVVVFDPATRECRRYDSRSTFVRPTHECILQPGHMLINTEAVLIECFRKTPMREFVYND